MGKIGKCCCVEGECCLCDPVWNYDNWSVALLGKTFAGTFSPADKPSPFTVENGCQSRQGDDCIIEQPVILLDCIQESSWQNRQFVNMVGTPPGFFSTPACYFACPQCFCNDATSTSIQIDEACRREGLVNWQYEDKGVTHSRAWQQEAYYGVAQMICCNSPANSVRFVFDFFYHAARFAAVSEQGFRRFRSVTYDCIYPPGQQVVDPTPTAVYGSWIEPVTVGSKPPCLPCEWTQSDFFGNCPTLESPCPPCPSYGCQNEVISFTMDWIYVTCQFIGFVDTDDDGICPIVDVDASGNRLVYYGSTTMNAYVGSNTNYCNSPLNGFGGNCLISPMSIVIEHRFQSDCIPCNEIPCNVTLNRVTGGSLGSSITECRFNADNDCSCGTISPLCKVIPASITMVLSPCT